LIGQWENYSDLPNQECECKIKNITQEKKKKKDRADHDNPHSPSCHTA
jgi:hypothetical protein